MGRKSVAVLDVRSSEIALFVGERGVNHTIVFKASKTEPYSGYAENEFFDEKSLSDAVYKALSSVEQTCGERVRELYIGVPAAFTEVIARERDIGFPKKRRVTQKDLDTLFLSGKEKREGYRLMRVTSMIFVTSDNRRVVDPIGISTTSLQAALSYFYCSDYYARVMEKIFGDMKITLHFLPTEFAMASYLIPSETRDECALFLDVGYMFSSLLVLYGNGVLAQVPFPIGRGHIECMLMEKFSLRSDVAGALLSRANLFAKEGGGKVEFNHRGAAYEIDSRALVDTVKEGLDMLCEVVGGQLESYTEREFAYKPLYVSGEGLAEIRGSLEHVSKRVNRVCEQLAPDLPLYNKPTMSSRIALADMAQSDNQKGGIINRIYNVFGG